MKKFLAIAIIAATFTACNDEKKNEETTTITKDTSMAVTKDTSMTVTKDTTPVVTTTTTTVDTLAKKTEVKKK